MIDYSKKQLLHMAVKALDTHTLHPSSVFSTDKLLALSTPTLRRLSCLLYLKKYIRIDILIEQNSN